VSPAFGDDPMFVEDAIGFHGQALFAVVATEREIARRACKLATMEIAAERPSVTVEDALERNETVLPDYAFGRGDAATAVAAAPRNLEGHLYVGGPGALLPRRPDRAGDPGRGRGHLRPFLDPASERGPARGRPRARHPGRLCDLRDPPHGRRLRGQGEPGHPMGGHCALGARVTGRPCKIRLDRDDDFILTGKRHDFRSDWQVGFDAEGRIQGYAVEHLARCGYSADLSSGVVDRTMFHSDNAYWMPAVRVASRG
jgi:xanthine dehydrogenase large subunit